MATQTASATGTILGPLISALVLVSVAAIVGKTEPLLGGRAMNWFLGLMLWEAFALLLGVLMLSLDFAARALAARPLPAVTHAWIAGLLAPIPLEICWRLLRPGDYTGTAFYAALLGPVLATVVVSRLVLWSL